MADDTGSPVRGGNLFAMPPGAAGSEHFEELLSRGGFRLERIVSTGQGSAPDFWYDQEVAEWVVLLSGSAELHFDGEAAPRRLAPGDWLDIAAHRRHRVVWTDATQPSVWLALHYR